MLAPLHPLSGHVYHANLSLLQSELVIMNPTTLGNLYGFMFRGNITSRDPSSPCPRQLLHRYGHSQISKCMKPLGKLKASYTTRRAQSPIHTTNLWNLMRLFLTATLPTQFGPPIHCPKWPLWTISVYPFIIVGFHGQCYDFIVMSRRASCLLALRLTGEASGLLQVGMFTSCLFGPSIKGEISVVREPPVIRTSSTDKA